jgi:hypothetical protein
MRAMGRVLVLALLAAAGPACPGGSGSGGGGGGNFPVTISLSAAAASSSTATLAWTDSHAAGSQYTVFQNGSAVGDAFSKSVTVSNLRPDTTYSFVVYWDVFPVGAMEMSNVATVHTPVDLPPSVPSLSSATPISPVRIDLVWTASTDDYGPLTYNVTRNGTRIAVGLSSTLMSDTDLVPGTLYSYTVSASDGVGNESAQSTPLAATTPADTTPPTAPSNVRAVYDAAYLPDIVVHVTWDPATDDGEVRGYRVYRNGAPIADTSALSFDDHGLAPFTSYAYTVTAYDEAGLESAAGGPASLTTSWRTTVVDGTVHVYGTAMARDAAGTLHILYQDAPPLGPVPQAGVLKHAAQAGAGWATEVLDTLGTSVLSTVGLAAAPDGSLHAGYSAWGDWKLHHAVWSGAGWSFEVAETNALDTETVAIAADSSGKVHLLYNYYQQILYATNASGTWVREAVDTMGVIGDAPIGSIAVDAGGVVHVAYYDNTNFDLKHAWRSGGVWQLETLDSAGDVGGTPSIALGGSGEVHIAYSDATSGHLKHATNASGSWVLETVDPAPNVGMASSIVLSPAGDIHLSYVDGAAGGIKYATNASGSWAAITVDGSGGGLTSLALDGAGYVHIAYTSRGALAHVTNHP